jgi:hypothetical protein
MSSGEDQMKVVATFVLGVAVGVGGLLALQHFPILTAVFARPQGPPPVIVCAPPQCIARF